MTTFSQLIDSMILETKRPDMRSEFVSYLNQTVREAHFEPERGNVVFLRANYRESQVQADVESGFSWTIPNPGVWQGVGAVRFDNAWDHGHQLYAQEVMAGRAGGLIDRAYQIAGDRLIFKGFGGLGASISIAYYEYPFSLAYFLPEVRPATFDSVLGWTYHADYDVDDVTRETARLLTSNWLLMRWSMVLEEGLRAKIYKRLSDTERARTSYSLYAQQRQGLITSESADNGGAW